MIQARREEEAVFALCLRLTCVGGFRDLLSVFSRQILTTSLDLRLDRISHQASIVCNVGIRLSLRLGVCLALRTKTDSVEDLRVNKVTCGVLTALWHT